MEPIQTTQRPMSRLATVVTVAVTAATVGAAVAVAASDPTPTPPPKIAIVARGDGANFADALAVGSVAGQLGAPVFTTAPTSLPDASVAALAGYAPELVIIPGGTAAVSAEVESRIETITGLPADKVVRAAGENRYATAAAIATIFEDQGIDPAYLPTGAKAVDADLLDGLDSTAFQPAGDYLTTSDVPALATTATQIEEIRWVADSWAEEDADVAELSRTVSCPDGFHAVGGGGQVYGWQIVDETVTPTSPRGWALTATGPKNAEAKEWAVHGERVTGTDKGFIVAWALCIQAANVNVG